MYFSKGFVAMQTLIKCIILEDNQADMDLLGYFVEGEPRLQLLQTFKNPLEAVAFIPKRTAPTNIHGHRYARNEWYGIV